MAIKKKHKKASQNANIVSFEELPHSPEVLRGRKFLLAVSLLFVLAFLIPFNIAWKLAGISAGILLAVVLFQLFIGRWMSSDANIKYLIGQQKQLQDKLKRLAHEEKSLVKSFESAVLSLNEKTASKTAELEQLLLRKTRLLSGEKQLLQAREARKRRMLAMADKRAQGLQKLQELEINKVCQQHKDKLAELEAELSKLNESEMQEIQDELSSIQQESIKEFLRKYVIKDTSVIGLSAVVVDKLAAVGVLTALELTSAKLDAAMISGASARMLLAWQQYLCQQADLQKPMFLKKTKKIRKKYVKPRLRIESELIEVLAKLRREPGEIRELFSIAGARLKTIESEIAGGTISIEESEKDFVEQLKDTNRQCDALQSELLDLEKIKEKYSQEHESKRRELHKAIVDLNTELSQITLPTVKDYSRIVVGL